jgi:hypothetical protein
VSAVNDGLRRAVIRADHGFDRSDRGERAGAPDEIVLAGGTRLWLGALEPAERDALATVFER